MTPQVRGACGFLFACRWGEGPVTVHKNALHSGKSVHVRKVSPVPGRPLGDDDGVDQRTGGPAGSCSVCSAAARGDAAGPGSRCGNHRCRLGWERSAGSGGFGFGFLLRRFAGAASADAVGETWRGGQQSTSVLGSAQQHRPLVFVAPAAQQHSSSRMIPQPFFSGTGKPYKCS